MINILCPTKSRPHAVAETYESWKATSNGDISQLIFVIDPESVETYPKGYTYFYSSSDSKGMVKAVNEASLFYTEGHNMFIGDDHRFRTPEWDVTFNDLCENNFAILYGNDLLQGERLPTAACLSRKVVDAMEGIMCPGTIKHLYVDDYWLKLGRDTNIIKYFPHIIIEHCHPGVGKAEWDEQYKIVSTPEGASKDNSAFVDYVNSDSYKYLIRKILNG